jgi:hypothetical protein
MSAVFAFICGVGLGVFVAVFWYRLDRPGQNSYVELCDERGTSGARRWQSPVYYDAWGSPFVYRHPDTKVYAMTLNPDGSVEEYALGDPKWKLVAGPEISFPSAPIKAVADAP